MGRLGGRKKGEGKRYFIGKEGERENERKIERKRKRMRVGSERG